MSITSRRRAKLIGGALFAASLAAASFATTTPVSADLGDSPYTESYIRVQPSAATWEDQTAPVIPAGSANAAAGSVEVLIPTNWESGDKIILQVYADNDAGVGGQQTNCLSAAQSISFAGPYPTSNVVAAAIGYSDGFGWAGDDGGDALVNAGTNEAANSDPKTSDTTQPGTPTFNVALTTSPSCGGVGVTDQIELTFSNTSLAPDGGQYSIAFTNIKYNVGAAVPAGPVHVVPFVRQADDASPGHFIEIDAFGDNMFDDPSLTDTWTDNAFVSPATFTATAAGGALISGYPQLLGSITMGELIPNAFANATNYDICFTVDGTTSITMGGAPTVTITGDAATAVGTVSVATPTADCVRLSMTNLSAVLKGTITINNLVATPWTTGPIGAYLAAPVSSNPLLLMNPDDQLQGNSGYYSDVNMPILGAGFTNSVDVPTRIGGNDRYETSAKIAANLGGEGDTCSDWAVLVSGSSYPDALSASYLAGALNYNVGETMYFGAVPVLLIGSDSVPPSVAAYMAAVGVKNVYIVGGTAAVSAAAETALRETAATKCTYHMTIDPTAPVPNQKLNVVRVAGADRYATNRAVVNLGSDIFEDNRNMTQLEFLQPAKHTAIVATGTGFADALAAGPVAYDGYPLILTDGTTLSTSARLALTDNDIAQVIIVGGTAAVSDVVKGQIAALGIQVERIAGADRYATATAWADFMAKGAPAAAVAGAWDGGMGWGTFEGILLASGTNYADALSAGPLGWWWDAPIILTDPTTLSANTQTWLVAHRASLDWITVLGLGSAVSTGVMNAAAAAIA